MAQGYKNRGNYPAKRQGQAKAKKGGGVGVKVLIGVLALVTIAGGVLTGCAWSAYKNYKDKYDELVNIEAMSDEQVAKMVECALPQNTVFGKLGVESAGRASAGKSGEDDELPSVLCDGETTVTVQFSSDKLTDVALQILNIGVTWEAAWANPDSEWAKGKDVNDYITIIPTENYTREAKLKNLAPFSEPIKVTAKLTAEPSKSATMTVDYLIKLPDQNGLVDFSAGLLEGGDINLFYELDEPLEGTAYGDFELTRCTLETNYDFQDAVRDMLTFNLEFKTYDFKAAGRYELKFIPKDNIYIYDGGLQYGDFIVGWKDFTAEQKDAVYYAWHKANEKCPYNMEFNVQVRYVYGDKNISYFEAAEYYCRLWGLEGYQTVKDKDLPLVKKAV